jgi:hypothetical protein
MSGLEEQDSSFDFRLLLFPVEEWEVGVRLSVGADFKEGHREQRSGFRIVFGDPAAGHEHGRRDFPILQELDQFGVEPGSLPDRAEIEGDGDGLAGWWS